MTATPPEGGTDYNWLPEGFTVREVQTNGVRLSAAVGGSGPVLVLLHGWPQTGRAWARVMPTLAENHTVVVPDLRGTGSSERPADGYLKTNQVKDMRGLVEGLGLSGPIVVVGHDIGAMVAFAWAVHRPEDLTAAVVLDCFLPGVDLEDSMNVVKGGSWHFGFFAAPHIPEMLFAGHELEFVQATFGARTTPGTFTDEELEFYARSYTGHDRARGGFEHYRALLEDGRENTAVLEKGKITTPLLLIGGKDSTGDQTIKALAPHAEKLTSYVADTSHFVAEEAPEWFVEKLTDFLANAGAKV
ncbi:alpha/beta fold hydrolase [Amycolatopsis pithecellobii]|uniref:Alpha/beta fold hydrolase n=1 Tax=Amycolatopsis pithecellobii TaxID=664692 RepID=A0A6N7ZB66_9PSEU|nr:alpha/beta hydrolase [Amycolatopsis pithecellobii]MTD59011.1 alpha/beta fold hydrolase [Amycolatopsis pithecellobii]